MNPEKHLPLRPVEFQILACLSRCPRHGYAILQDISDQGEGQAIPGLATLYRAILRLEKEALIAQVEGDPIPSEEDRRRVYRLTPSGRVVVLAEARRLASLVESVEGGSP